MGIIICEKHGRTGIITGILEDICQKMLDNETLNQNELATIIVDYFDEGELLFSDKYLVTIKFKEKQNLNDYYIISNEDEEDLIIRPIQDKMGAMCGKCYEEYLARHNLNIDFK